ncbi:hypothetical protein ICN48_12110 [Polynucleobacter sp. JS-Safj-400b-B2]|uniref:hypothetical protein n=1 Tax=Polynucleobacter sp. JS-Safj-400b-B2 TaxID=2576921 RepID=UPI001C0E69EF|nr:hypothetical protein [Polynucleobacter sp. JS-Safj-400b-B2]MBU3626973.1 hypothetical protein [Polynucleobacter sp. JS-Safj-400b-B2]
MTKLKNPQKIAQNFRQLCCGYIGFLMLIQVSSVVNAQTSSSTMSEEAKAGQNIQNPLYPQIQLPLTYNFNQKLGTNSGGQQSQIGFNPIIPVDISDDLQLIVNPMLTYNHNANSQQATNQSQPLQVATFFAPTYVKTWYFGAGPFVQVPATNANNGSKQTGVGVSAGAFYTPENWVIGMAMFNSWGIGNNLSGGTANVLNAQPTISYTTDKAWTYNLQSQIIYNYDAKSATNQLTLSGGKTYKWFDYHVQWQVGPTYMVTSTPSSPKGVGAFVGLTVLMPK